MLLRSFFDHKKLKNLFTAKELNSNEQTNDSNKKPPLCNKRKTQTNIIYMTSTTAHPHTTMVDYNFANAPTTYPSRSIQQSQHQQKITNTALVPATTIVPYSNYTFPAGSDDLIDLDGYGASAYSSPPPPSADDLISFEGNNNNRDNTAYVTQSAPTTAAMTSSDDNNQYDRRMTSTVDMTALLQDRDDEFVKNLPSALIEEQQRILAQIQERNAMKNNTTRNDQQLVSYNTDGHERYLQRFDGMPSSDTDDAGRRELLPAEVHPRKYQMKTERKLKTATSATAGAIIGGVLLGPAWPVGAVVGGAAGGYAGKVAARSGERKQQRKWDQQQFNMYTTQGHCDVQSTNVAFA